MKRRAKQYLPKRAAGAFPDFLYKSLAEMEGDWPDEPDDTDMVRHVRNLRRKPLIILTNEQIRLALSQHIGFPRMLTLTIIRLREDPLRSGDMYEADVLRNALALPRSVWSDEAKEVEQIADAIVPTLVGNDNYDLLLESYKKFKAAGLARE